MYNPLFFMLSTKKSFETFSEHIGAAIVSKSLVLYFTIVIYHSAGGAT